MDNSELVFKLRQELRGVDDDFEEPVIENVWGSYGKCQLVGNGKQTNRFCGAYIALKGLFEC